MFSVDSFKGMIVASYNGIDASSITDISGQINHRDALLPVFSPDSQFVLCGSPLGPIHVWKTVALGSGQLPGLGEEHSHRQATMAGKLEAHHRYPRSVLFNPVRCIVASACQNVALWIPKPM